MPDFAPSGWITVAFTLLTLGVVAMDLVVLGAAAPAGRRRVWLRRGVVVAAVWMAAHALIARSGVLEGQGMPPPVMPYLAANMVVGVLVVLSPLGRRLATLPWAVLVGLHAFRLPLEVLLHALYTDGVLPVQMTWSGRNLDVVTGILALGLGLYGRARPLSRGLVWAFALVGFGLLVNVVGTAVLSAPTPFRTFLEGPPVVLPFHVPYNWIVNVHVWTALVGHLVLFRALLTRPRG